MDSQIVFNYVTDHLARQKVPSLVFQSGCALRGDNGTKCAVGCLIPDSEYFADMEDDSGVDWNSEGDFNHWLRVHFAPTLNQFKLLWKLQICHDIAGPQAGEDLSQNAKNKWPLRLESLAKSFDLVFNRVAFENHLADPAYK